MRVSTVTLFGAFIGVTRIVAVLAVVIILCIGWFKIEHEGSVNLSKYLKVFVTCVVLFVVFGCAQRTTTSTTATVTVSEEQMAGEGIYFDGGIKEVKEVNAAWELLHPTQTYEKETRVFGVVTKNVRYIKKTSFPFDF